MLVGRILMSQLKRETASVSDDCFKPNTSSQVMNVPFKMMNFVSRNDELYIQNDQCLQCSFKYDLQDLPERTARRVIRFIMTAREKE